MKTIITINAYASMPNRYLVKSNLGNLGIGATHDVSGAEAAAAKAMEIAIRCSSYHIFAPKKVLDCIPFEMRSSK